MVKENINEHRDTGPIRGKELIIESFVPKGGWVEVDSSLTLEERQEKFPLGEGQQYRFKSSSAAEVQEAIQQEEIMQSTPNI